MQSSDLKNKISNFIFSRREIIIAVFLIITGFMVWQASQLKVDAGFEKLLPLQHPYIKTLLQYRDEFGGGNRIVVALMQEEGDIFNAEYFTTLKEVNDAIFFLNGVNKSRVKSLFTPNTRYTEVVEDGFDGGPVIPSKFNTSAEMLSKVRQNIIMSGELGRLVTTDFTGSLIMAELLDRDPESGERLDYKDVAKALEKDIRQKYQTDKITVHIIGFAKSIGDIAEGAKGVVAFFGFAFIISAFLLYLYSGSLRLSALTLVCSVVAVIWQLGFLTTLGFGIDPMSILVPFLVFAIGVSHGVQMISGWIGEILYGGEGDILHPVVPAQESTQGLDSLAAAKKTFLKLVVPGSIALLSDTIGFFTVLLIDVGIIQEMAITASIGVAIIILTNLILLPVLLSFIKIKNLDKYKHKRHQSETRLDKVWVTLAKFTQPLWSVAVLSVALVLLLVGLWLGGELKVGDLHQGVPELRESSRYNQDTKKITESFDIGVDVLSVIIATPKDGCIDYEVMSAIDRFSWHVRNIPGVQSVVSLPVLAKKINAGYNEGNPKWQVLSRNRFVLSQSISPINTNSGLLNASCEAMPVLVFTEDHKAETINRIIRGIEAFEPGVGKEKFDLRMASGNVGIIAATNDAVKAAQLPIMIYVYLAIFVLCIITFKTFRGTLCILLPLSLVSVLSYALMAVLDIGLKVSTLPVVALGVGIGVDYGIYIFSRMHIFLKDNMSLQEAYYRAMRLTGKPVVFTAITLAVGVFTWNFSALKFQADMGLLLTFMFLVNMLAAIFLIPALAHWLLKNKKS